MPVTFQENDESKCEFKISTNLPPRSISRITWIKDPNHRKPGQQFANVKIQCKDADTANSLILGSGRINYLGSPLRLHKDTKDHNACNRCQKYGHIASGCKEEQFTCGKCGGDHKTWECTTNGLKCTPCGMSDHRTNDEKCPKCIERSNIYHNRMPEAFMPYFLTSEKWTWGLANSDPQTHTQASTRVHPAPRPSATSPRPRHIFKGHDRQQRTLTNTGFIRNPTQTGANNTPLGRPPGRPTASLSNPTPPPSPPPPQQQASGSGQQANNTQRAENPQATHTQQ